MESTGPCRLVVGEVTLFPLVKADRLLKPLGDLLRPPSTPKDAAADDDAEVLLIRADAWGLLDGSVLVVDGNETVGPVASRELPADTEVLVVVVEAFNRELSEDGVAATELNTVEPPAPGPDIVVVAVRPDVEGCGATEAAVLANPSVTKNAIL